MRIKLLKLQSGGGLPPLASYLPITINNQQLGLLQLATVDKSSTSKSNDELGLKDIAQLLKDSNLLHNDSDYIQRKIETTIREVQAGIIDSSQIALEYSRIVSLLNKGKTSKELYNEAAKHMYERLSADELALTSNGNLINLDLNGNITGFVNVNDYVKNPNKYNLATNSDLLALRTSKFALTDNLLTFVDNSISIHIIMKNIKDKLLTLGHSDIKGYVGEGAKILIEQINRGEGSSILDLENKEIITKTNAMQARKALAAVLNMLNPNEKALLKARAGGDLQVEQLIGTYLFSQVSDEIKKGSDGDSDGSGDVELSNAILFAAGRGYKSRFEINPGSIYSTEVRGIYGKLQTHSGEGIGQGDNLTYMSRNSDLNTLLNMDSATFGGLLINQLQGTKVILNNSDIKRVELPIDKSAPNGIIRPDFKLNKLLEEADKRIKNPNDYNEVNRVYQELGLPPKYTYVNNQWRLNEIEYAPFAMVSATLDSRALENPNLVDDNIVRIVSDDKDIKLFEQSVINAREGDKKYKEETDTWWFSADHPIYEGQIFIPIRLSYLAALLNSKKPKVDISLNEMSEMDNRAELGLPTNRDSRPKYVNPNAEIRAKLQQQ